MIAVVIPALLMGVVLAGFPATAAEAPKASPESVSAQNNRGPGVVTITTLWSADLARPGDHVVLAVIFRIRDGYHINADAAQVLPMQNFKPVPTRVTITQAHESLRLEPVCFPRARPIQVAFSQDDLMVFKDPLVVFVPMSLEKTATEESIRVGLQVECQACDFRICKFPERKSIEAVLPVSRDGRTPVMINQAIFAAYGREGRPDGMDGIVFDLFGRHFSVSASRWWGLVTILLVSGAGGILLNFTPCVLPMVPIKIMSLSNAAQDRSRCLSLGMAMFAGVLGFWMALGSVVAMAKEFTATNQLFQYPVFTISIGMIIAIMALGMSGFFTVRLPGFIYGINPSSESLKGSFLIGILTAILSTPCTAPFMGAAIAWAVTRRPLVILITFAAIGTGMALPYLVLAACPRMVGRMPRSGPAGVLIKQVMSLLMMAAAAYFIGTGVSAVTMNPPDPPGKSYWWAVMAFSAAGGLWLAVQTFRITSRKLLKMVFGVLGLAVLIASAYGGVRLTGDGPVDWVYFTPERFRDAIGSKKTVLVVFTAEWCLNCKALEQAVIGSRKVSSLLAGEETVAMKVDITGDNPEGKKKLHELGQLSIPLLVIYSRQGKEVFRSDFYTVEQISEALVKAGADT